MSFKNDQGISQAQANRLLFLLCEFAKVVSARTIGSLFGVNAGELV